METVAVRGRYNFFQKPVLSRAPQSCDTQTPSSRERHGWSVSITKASVRLERHAFTLDLVDPRTDTLLRLVGLIVLVAREANEFAVDDRFGLLVLITVRRHGANDLGALLLETLG